MSRNSSCGSFFFFSPLCIHFSLSSYFTGDGNCLRLMTHRRAIRQMSLHTFLIGLRRLFQRWYRIMISIVEECMRITFLLLACWLAVYESCHLEHQRLQSFLNRHGSDLEVFGIPVDEIDCYHLKHCPMLFKKLFNSPSRGDGPDNIGHSHFTLFY